MLSKHVWGNIAQEISSDVHLRLAGHSEQGPALTETSPVKKLLVSNNQSNSGYLLIYLYYKFFERRKEENIWNKIEETTFADIVFFVCF